MDSGELPHTDIATFQNVFVTRYVSGEPFILANLLFRILT
jgi:hypothetical protein